MPLRFVLNVLRPQTARSFLFRRKHDDKSVVVFDVFRSVQEKNKNTYIEMLKIFEQHDPRRRNHVEFIYAAMKHMKEFNVHKDLEVYKALVEVLPKGRFIPENLIQAEFMHYPKQQQCAIDLLEQMEDNGVMPDFEMEDILLAIFGKRGFPLRKFWRMMYWMPKFRNLSPWYLPQNLPNETMELAKLAIQRISSVDQNTKVTVLRTEDVEDAIDHTWIVSGQSPIQIALLAAEAKERREMFEKEAAERKKLKEESIEFSSDNIDEKDFEGKVKGNSSQVNESMEKLNNINSKKKEALVVHGAYQVYLRDQRVSYFILSGPAKNRPKEIIDKDDVSNLDIPSQFGKTSVPALASSVHEQDDGTILAVCATGSSSRDSLLSWIRLLEKNGNPDLAELPVVFTLTAPPSELVIQITDPVTAE